MEIILYAIKDSKKPDEAYPDTKVRIRESSNRGVGGIVIEIGKRAIMLEGQELKKVVNMLVD